MADLKALARVVRWTTESMTFQLGFIPEDKLDWKPTPEAKSALQVAGEVEGVMRMILPIFSGGEMQMLEQLPHRSTLEEAKSELAAASAAYADALDAAGPELERNTSTPFGDMWAPYAVTFPMIDLLHHHGQITYLQSLLGDGESHGDMESLHRWWGPPRG